MARHLPVLTQSSITTFRRCPREYFFRYVECVKPIRKSAALHFGSLFHAGLNAWWEEPQKADKFTAAIVSLRREATNTETDPFDLAKAEALMAGYTARWVDEPYQTESVEKRFDLPIERGAWQIIQSRTFVENGGQPLASCRLRGSIDVIAWKYDRAGNRHSLYNVEHKTTSQDISAGSDYWRHVIALDAQVSTYDAAAHAMGHDIRGCIYDVIRKPDLLPLKETPEAMRKYTKPTKQEPIPRLYANQRERDETPDEYRDRIIAELALNPDKYFARATIVRLDRDNEEHARDVEYTAQMIQFAEQHDAWPRSPNACERYRRMCEFFPVCSGETSITDGTRYEKKTAQHEEIT